MKKFLLVLMIVICLTGCSAEKNVESNENKYEVVNKVEDQYQEYKSISYDEYKQKLDNKDSFIVLLYQTGCSHCEEFEPRLNEVIKKYNLEIFGLNLSDLTDKEYAIVKNKTFISGTPTTVSFKEGKYEDKLVGNKSEQDILKFLVETEYLKEK